MNQLCKFLCVSILVLFANGQLLATSYKAPDEPAINLENALKLAKDFAVKDNKNIGKYYVDRVWLQLDEDRNPQFWVVSWASPEAGWYFTLVRLDGKVWQATKSDIISDERPRFKIVLPK